MKVFYAFILFWEGGEITVLNCRKLCFKPQMPNSKP